MLADYQPLVDSLVRDRDQVITTEQRDAAIDAALLQYSGDSPRALVEDATSSGGIYLDLPADWTDNSKLISAEYPIGNVPVTTIPNSEISIYATPDARQLALPDALDAGEQVRLTYTANHLLDDANDTVPKRHRLALASLAASILCGQLASYYAGEGEPTISADTVNRQNKSQTFEKRARSLAAMYASVVGPAQSDRNKAASVTVTPERSTSLGYGRLFHPVRNWPVS